ncbi:hypothetical protein PG984_002736 [Apiospora sp. TS-2023a]
MTGTESPTQNGPTPTEELYLMWTANDGRFNVHDCLRQFVDDPRGLLLRLRETGGIIAGDLPTQLLCGLSNEDWADTRMDIMLPGFDETKDLEMLTEFFVQSGYREVSPSELEIDKAAIYRNRTRERILFRSTNKVHILKTNMECLISKMPENYMSTASMNAITGTHVVSFFPKLTFIQRRMLITMKVLPRHKEEVKKCVSRGWSRDKSEDTKCCLRGEESVVDVEPHFLGFGDPEKKLWEVSGMISNGLRISEDGQLRRSSDSPHEVQFVPCKYWLYF